MSELPLPFLERPVANPAGLLVLHHGRGSDERDLLGLADALDPGRRLHVVTPRGPLVIPGLPGHHWYAVPRVGYPDPATFEAAYAALSAFHDALAERVGVPAERTVLGGFSMGAVMSYATGLGPGRPRPAGILALSGFVPTVEGWSADLASRAGLPVLHQHGTRDPVIGPEFADRAEALLGGGGLDVAVHRFPGGHHVDAGHLPATAAWLDGVLGPGAA